LRDWSEEKTMDSLDRDKLRKEETYLRAPVGFIVEHVILF